MLAEGKGTTLSENAMPKFPHRHAPIRWALLAPFVSEVRGIADVVTRQVLLWYSALINVWAKALRDLLVGYFRLSTKA